MTMSGRSARMNRYRSRMRPVLDVRWPAATRMPLSTSSRYGPSRRNKYIERSQTPASSAFSTCTAARSAPPPANDGSTKQTLRRELIQPSRGRGRGLAPELDAQPPGDDRHHFRGLRVDRVRTRRLVSAFNQAPPHTAIGNQPIYRRRNSTAGRNVEEQPVLLRGDQAGDAVARARRQHEQSVFAVHRHQPIEWNRAGAADAIPDAKRQRRALDRHALRFAGSADGRAHDEQLDVA